MSEIEDIWLSREVKCGKVTTGGWWMVVVKD